MVYLQRFSKRKFTRLSGVYSPMRQCEIRSRGNFHAIILQTVLRPFGTKTISVLLAHLKKQLYMAGFISRASTFHVIKLINNLILIVQLALPWKKTLSKEKGNSCKNFFEKKFQKKREGHRKV